MLIRDAQPADFAQILVLNAESEHFLSPLDSRRLDQLHREALYHRVLEREGRIGAFLLAFREGCTYDSPNYQWFCQHFDRFIYIDRIVVSRELQGQGLGQEFYRDLFSFARQCQVPRITCEFDIEPPNEASRHFHERFGFSEVGTQMVTAGGKQVSLQAVSIADLVRICS